jgi:hypothetical protein
MSFLERIRQKPSHTKTQYALLVAGGATLLVALVWMSTLPARLDSIGALTLDESNPKSPQPTESANPLTNFLDETKTQFGTAVGGVMDTVETPEFTTDVGVAGTALRNLGSGEANIEQTNSSTTEVQIPTIASPEDDPKEATTLGGYVKTASTTNDRRVILIATTTSQKIE